MSSIRFRPAAGKDGMLRYAKTLVQSSGPRLRVEVWRHDGLMNAQIVALNGPGSESIIARSHGVGYTELRDAFRSLRKDLKLSAAARAHSRWQ